MDQRTTPVSAEQKQKSSSQGSHSQGQAKEAHASTERGRDIYNRVKRALPPPATYTANRSSPRPYFTQHDRQDVQPEACLVRNPEQKAPQKEAPKEFFHRRKRPSFKTIEIVRN
jgi:hypothetical protein